jgi:hypothetical protein
MSDPYFERERCDECGRLDALRYDPTDEEIQAYTAILGERALGLLEAHLSGTTTEERAAAADLIGFDPIHTEDYAVLMTMQVVLAAVRGANRAAQ